MTFPHHDGSAGPARLPDTPADPIPFAIAQHRRAFKAHDAARACLVELHEAFDREWDIEDTDAIHEAVTTVHGPHAAEEVARCFAAADAANAATQDEDEAWAESRPLSRAAGRIWRPGWPT